MQALSRGQANVPHILTNHDLLISDCSHGTTQVARVKPFSVAPQVAHRAQIGAISKRTL
jgi:hypothetical protein